MTQPFFRATGVHRVEFGERRGDYERPDMTLVCFDRDGRQLSEPLDLRGFQLDPWVVQERIYDGCDEVRILDHNADGGQFEFGRYVAQFIRHGNVVGEHLADTVAIRPAG